LQFFKRLGSVALAGVLAISILPLQAAAATLGDYWKSDETNVPPKETLRVVWTDTVNNGEYFSTDFRNKANSAKVRDLLEQDFRTVLGVCGDKIEVGCISDVSYKVDGEWNKAVLEKSPGQRDVAWGIIVNGNWDKALTSTYKADPSKNILAASQPNLFSFPKAPHRQGDKYWVNAVVQSYMVNGKARIKGFDIGAWGTEIKPMCQSGDDVQTASNIYCAPLFNLPKDLEIRVSVYLGNRINELTGWFDGRMMNPDIDFGVVRKGYVTVTGKPVEVSTASTEFIPKGDPLYDVSPEVEKMQGSAGEPRQVVSRFDGIWAWERFGSKVSETAQATNTYWRLSSWLTGDEGRYSCTSVTGVRGVVLSNAIAYTPTAPKWNKASRSLNFEVASTHLKSDGSLNEGFYDLLVNEKIARCIWGNGITGNKADIQITDKDGKAQVATTTFALSHGWARFKVYGYHYSMPNISVKVPAAADEQAATSPVEKTTITCVNIKNKKLTKKITAVAPKCPTGYKKKP
jgi:hypothetical protein